MTRRSISGIFIFDKFEGEEKRVPTCFEDCQESTKDAWLDTLSEPELKNLSKRLAEVLVEIGDAFSISVE